MTKKFTDNEILEDLRNVAKYLNTSPNTEEYKRLGKYNLSTILRRFGKWEAVLSKCGLKPRKLRKKRVSDIDLLNDLIRVAKKVGRQPTFSDYVKWGKHCTQTYDLRFGGWENAFKGLGLKYTDPRLHNKPVSDKDITKNLEYVKSKIGNFPTLSEYRKLGEFSPLTLYRKANTNKWGKVLVKFVNLDENKIDYYSSSKKENFKNKTELLEEIKNLAKYLRHSPSRKEFTKYKFNSGNICNRFKIYKWDEILKLAGLPPAEKRNANKRLKAVI